jgi:hypothetical protein
MSHSNVYYFLPTFGSIRNFHFNNITILLTH